MLHNAEDLQVEMFFLSREEMYQTIKPYSMRYPPQGDFPQSNIKREKHSLDIRTMRDEESCLNFDDCGFGIMNLDSKMRYEDFEDRARINSLYAKEICQALKSHLKATHVRVLNFAVYISKTASTNRPTADSERFGGVILLFPYQPVGNINMFNRRQWFISVNQSSNN